VWGIMENHYSYNMHNEIKEGKADGMLLTMQGAISRKLITHLRINPSTSNFRFDFPQLYLIGIKFFH
jgi:hypothetical protein